MKVYIGKHTPWWSSGIFQNYMNKKYDYDWNEPNTNFEKFLEKVEDSLQWVYHHTFNRVFARMKRKVKVKIHDYDVWGLDNTLAHIILPALKLLKERKTGTPFVDNADVPEHMQLSQREQNVQDYGHYDKTLNATEEEIKSVVEKHQAQWDWVMNEMIYAFECALDPDWDTDIWTKYDEKWTVEAIDDIKVIQARISNGFILFGKYYQSLWD
jgi:hypothetical protein